MKIANHVTKRWLATGVLLGTLLFFILIAALTYTSQAVAHLRKFEFELASTKAQPALFVVRQVSTVTFHLIPDIELWRESLALIKESNDLRLQLIAVSHSLLQPQTNNTPPANLTTLTTSLETMADRIQRLEAHCSRSLIIKYQVKCDQIDQIKILAQDGLILQRWLTQKNPTLIVLFQNTEELRATGGFMGSYAKVSFNDGAISELLIEDIYEPDGQFQGYIEAPTGAKEYLSSGRGLRLPDANWHPDFPTSAQTILTYFAFGKERSVDGIVAINSDLVERLLTVTGDIFLPDYGVTVTSNNFTTLARADRDQFFPGSQQKTNFLSHFFNVFKVKLSELTPDQQQQLVPVIQQALADKTVQLYSTDEQVQKVFVTHQLAGELKPLDHADQLLYLVESNVGINKANKTIERQVDVNVIDQQVSISIHFNNHNQDLGYVNYQRVIVPIEWTLDPMDLAPHVWVDGHAFREVDSEVITNSQGQQFRQIGFLVTVPVQASRVVDLTFTTSTLTKGSSLTILKQPGLPPTPYTVTTPTKVETIILEKDTIIQL